MLLRRTKAGTKYLNELSMHGESDSVDSRILWWAGNRRGHGIDPGRLTYQENKDSVRKLFEAGYLEIEEDEEE